MSKIGIIVFGNASGIGYQTKRLTQLIRPDRVLFIDSTSFSKNKKQHPEWYEGFSGYRIDGFPTPREVRVFLTGLTHVLCVENPLGPDLTMQAQHMGVKVFIQTNWEFNDFLDKPDWVKPYKFIMPSFWKLPEMEQKFGREKVIYLPPPIDPNEFKEARERNFERTGKKRFLHIAGTLAIHDRNGTLDLLNAVAQTTQDFELVINSQHELPEEYISGHSRVKYRIGSFENPSELYKDFDAVIMPRRYGGLCLPMCEALMSGLPVLMPDISPNKELLPKKWLFPAYKKMEFKTRTMIDVYESNILALSSMIDRFANADLEQEKLDAFDLAYNSFSTSTLKNDYERVFER